MPTPSRTGYKFDGWYTETSGGTKVESTTTVKTAYPHTLYAHWVPNTYIIKYISNGGTGTMEDTIVTYGTLTRIRDNAFTKAGYTFDGWHIYRPSLDKWLYTLSSGDPEFYTLGEQPSGATLRKYTNGDGSATATPIDNDIVELHAQWTANSYTVVYNGNGNTGGSTANSTHTYGVASNLRTNGFTKTGYTFAGWATSASGSVEYTNGQSVSNLTSTPGGTVNLYAKWTANTYTVTYNANGGSGEPSSQTKTHGVGLILSSQAPTRSGYNFKGWSTSSTATSATYLAGGTYTANDSVILYAVWETATVPVTGVTLNKEGTHWIAKTGGSLSVTATVSPSSATNKNVTWSSSNTSVATVSNGTISAVGAGSTTITARTSDGGYTDSVDVVVYNAIFKNPNNYASSKVKYTAGYKEGGLFKFTANASVYAVLSYTSNKSGYNYYNLVKYKTKSGTLEITTNSQDDGNRIIKDAGSWIEWK